MSDDRIQREIEDILSKLDDLPAERKKRRGVRRKASNFGHSVQSALEPLTRISMGQLMLVSLGLVVLALVMMSINPMLGRWLVIAGIILFFTSFILSALGRGPRGSAPKQVKYWRDRPMTLDDDAGGPGFFDRVRGWFGGGRSPRR
jgi:hypothetical protein